MTSKMYSVAILAGGLATRLRPLTEKIPKSLISVADEPFIVHQLRLLKAQAITEVVLCLGYLGEQIEMLVGDGKDFGLKLRYSYDGAELLGTAGSLKKALELLSDDFFVLYGDSYLPCNFDAVQQVFIEQKKLGLMTVFCNQGQWDSSNVEFADGKITAYDKLNKQPSMQYIDYGLGVFNKNAFDLVPEYPATYDLAALYQTLLAQDQLAAFEVEQRFYEIGSRQGIAELDRYLHNNCKERLR